VLLAAAGVPQVPTRICAQDADRLREDADTIGYPVVVKRTHGAQGRWVRRAADPVELAAVLAELAAEGPGALLLQPLVAEAAGSSVRAIVTGGMLLASTRRRANPPEWRSNVAGGAGQSPVDLSAQEREAVLGAAAALGLRHAGIDLLPTSKGSLVLEVNSCPDFTSMLPYFEQDLVAEVLDASLAPPRPA
jgi:ribosomal protein S6--L-glutamate ligase